MKKIYLFCSAGMSTSMLASNMQDVANAHNLPIEVLAFPIGKMAEIVHELHPDCILLGPQVKFTYEDIEKKYGGEQGLPIGVIGVSEYGMMDGEKVLKSAIHLMKQRKLQMKER